MSTTHETPIPYVLQVHRDHILIYAIHPQIVSSVHRQNQSITFTCSAAVPTSSILLMTMAKLKKSNNYTVLQITHNRQATILISNGVHYKHCWSEHCHSPRRLLKTKLASLEFTEDLWVKVCIRDLSYCLRSISEAQRAKAAAVGLKPARLSHAPLRLLSSVARLYGDDTGRRSRLHFTSQIKVCECRLGTEGPKLI